MEQIFIVCAAIWYNDGVIRVHLPKNVKSGIVICGLRHCNCFQILSEIFDKESLEKSNIIQGFLTSKNTFVDRESAYEIALRAKQIISNTNITSLISEDLY